MWQRSTPSRQNYGTQRQSSWDQPGTAAAGGWSSWDQQATGAARQSSWDKPPAGQQSSWSQPASNAPLAFQGGATSSAKASVTAAVAAQIALRLKTVQGQQQAGRIQVQPKSPVDTKKDYVGVVASYDADSGRGAIDCKEIAQLLRMQVYVHKNVLLGSAMHVGDWVRFKIHLNAKGMPQAQAPLKPVPPTYITMSGFSEDVLARGPDELISSVNYMLQAFGPLAVNPYMSKPDEVSLAYATQDQAEEVIANLGEANFNVELHPNEVPVDPADGGAAADEFYDLVAQSKGTIGDTLKLDQSKQYLGVIKQLDSEGGRGFIESEEVKAIANCMVYVHRNVLDGAQIKLGDKVRFRVHLNAKGLPQAQRPLEPVYEKPKGQMVTMAGFPEEWSSLDKEVVVAQIEGMLTPFGPLISPPTLAYGCESATAVFEEVADATAAIKSLHGEVFKIRCIDHPAVHDRRAGRRAANSSAVLIDGFPAAWTGADVAKLVRVHCGIKWSINVEILTAKGASTGSARMKFSNNSFSGKVVNEFSDQKVAGTKISVSVEGGGPQDGGAYGRSGDGEEGGDFNSLILFLDELFMPQRPTVEPSPTDCEVWVDPLPDEVDLPGWLVTFGEAEEVYRLRDHDTNLEGSRGYVKFLDHASALRCVEAGAGVWSESERALGSRAVEDSMNRARGGSKRSSGGGSCYPISVVKRIMGSEEDGRPLHNIREELGLKRLRMRGEGLANAQKRLHFLVEGSDLELTTVLPELEKLIAEIHGEIFLKIVEGWKPHFDAPVEADKDFIVWRPPGMELVGDGAAGSGGWLGKRKRGTFNMEVEPSWSQDKDGNRMPKRARNGETIQVDTELIGMLIGKGGETIKSISKKTGCRIEIEKNRDQERKDKRKVMLAGSSDAVDQAMDMIEEVLSRAREHL